MKNSKGFTLVELAIVLTIIGLLVAGAAAALQGYILKKREAELIQKTNAITSALALYIQDEGYFYDDDGNPSTPAAYVRDLKGSQFPCPADPELGPGDANYGVESRSPAFPDTHIEPYNPGDCVVTGGIRSSGSGPNTVYHGAVPFVTLGLTGAQTIDPYKNKFSYSVSKTVSDADAFKMGRKPDGAIEVEKINSAGSTTIYNVPFVLVAHGPTGAGSYSVSGNQIPCDASANRGDGENCNGDEKFIDANDYRVTRAGSSEFYDDTIFTSLRGIADKEEYWANAEGVSDDVVNLNPGNVGIGPNVQQPLARLHVQANTSAIADSSVGGYDGSAGTNFSIIAEGDGDDSGGILITTAEPAGPAQDQYGLTLWNSDLGDVVFHINTQGDATAQAYLYSSDERLKENIRDLDPDTLKNLMLLRIIKYNLIEGSGGDKIGVIAQQLQEYFPELVHEDKDGMLSVDYVGLVGPIIKAIQEMQTEHKNDVNELEDRIEKLERDIQSTKENN